MVNFSSSIRRIKKKKKKLVFRSPTADHITCVSKSGRKKWKERWRLQTRADSVETHGRKRCKWKREVKLTYHALSSPIMATTICRDTLIKRDCNEAEQLQAISFSSWPILVGTFPCTISLSRRFIHIIDNIDGNGPVRCVYVSPSTVLPLKLGQPLLLRVRACERAFWTTKLSTLSAREGK